MAEHATDLSVVPEDTSTRRSESSDRLCQRCRLILQKYVRNEEHMFTLPYNERNGERGAWVHHHSAEALEAAAQKGCHICLILQADVARADPDRSDKPRGFTVMKTDIDDHEGNEVYRDFTLYVYFIQADSIDDTVVSEQALDKLEIHPRNPDQDEFLVKSQARVSWLAADDHNRRFLDEHEVPSELILPAGPTITEASLKTADHWLQTCLNTHLKCRSTTHEPRIYPSRLLQLSDSDPTHIRLRDCRDEPTLEPYVALSHRWGISSFKTLNLKDLPEWKSRIALETLSPTFQDAIRMTARLGFRLLWIDSLCIIQDSVEDWQRESAMMDSIFENAICTISASASTSPRSGLSMYRPEIRHHLLERFDVGDPMSRTVPCHIRQELPDWWDCHVADTSLARRGWVFQERLLSHRILHFTHDQLAWECNGLSATEFQPGGLSGGSTFSKVSSNRISMKHWIPNDNDDDPVGWQYGWHTVVEGYSGLALTKSTDKLVALSGVANQYRQCIEEETEYIVGLWRSSLVKDLGWFGTLKGTKRTRPYRAPSWSWAAVDGKVHYMKAGADDCVCELVKTNVVLVDPRNLMGAVTEASIVLKGKGLSLHRSTTIQYLCYPSHNTYEIQIPISEEHTGCLTYDDLDDQPDEMFLFLLTSTCVMGARVYSVETDLSGPEQYKGLHNVCSLALAKVANPDSSDSLGDTYRRVGFAILEIDYSDASIGSEDNNWLRLFGEVTITIK